MSKNKEIKELLDREGAIAYAATKNTAEWLYTARSSQGYIRFRVPIKDVNKNNFGDHVDASLLMKWIST